MVAKADAPGGQVSDMRAVYFDPYSEARVKVIYMYSKLMEKVYAQYAAGGMDMGMGGGTDEQIKRIESQNFHKDVSTAKYIVHNLWREKSELSK